MEPRHFLRIEGLAAFVAALAVFWSLSEPLWVLAAVALAPDLSMLGYLAGPRIGSHAYNVVHTYTTPLALAGLGYWTGAPLAIAVAAVWTAHIGADRLVGYGLKFESGFKDTHLHAQPAPVAALVDEE